MNNISQAYEKLHSESHKVLVLILKYQACMSFYNALPPLIAFLILMVGFTQLFYSVFIFPELFKFVLTILLVLLAFWVFWIKSYLFKRAKYEEAIRLLHGVLNTLENFHRTLYKMNNSNDFDWFYEEIESIGINTKDEFNLSLLPVHFNIKSKLRVNSHYRWIQDCVQRRDFWQTD